MRRVSTSIWLHYLHFSGTLGEKAIYLPIKNAVYSFEQILEAAPHKIEVVEPSHKQGMLGIAGEAQVNLWPTFFYGLSPIDIPVLTTQLTHTYIRSVWTTDAI